MATYECKSCGVPGNHSPYFIVDDSALDKGVRAFVHLVDDYPDKF